MDAHMTTTGFTLDGYRVIETLGVARGICVRSRSIVGNIAARLQTVVGGNISVLMDLCEHTRAEAFEILLAHAERLGANAVIGIRYDAAEILPGSPKCCATGLRWWLRRSEREAGSGKREAGSGKREAGSGKREAGSGKREAGQGVGRLSAAVKVVDRPRLRRCHPPVHLPSDNPCLGVVR
jgi:uncharacterized protein YbjQ (UPF0145 family)